eukprot:gene31927-38601_t
MNDISAIESKIRAVETYFGYSEDKLQDALKQLQEMEIKLQEKENLILAQKGAARYENRAYVVNDWKSGLRREVTYTKGDSLRRFPLSVSISFDTGPSFQLYALCPNFTHDQRVKIESNEGLRAILKEIDDNLDFVDILYVYPEDGLPTSSPSKEVASPLLTSPLLKGEAENKSETTSSDQKSDRSTYQKRFKTELTRRDRSRCLLCGCEDALIGVHIVDAEAKLSSEEQQTLKMFTGTDRYSIFNGLLLCATCHTMYDNWQLSVDLDGYLIKWTTDIGWTQDSDVNVYPDPSN